MKLKLSGNIIYNSFHLCWINISWFDLFLIETSILCVISAPKIVVVAASTFEFAVYWETKLKVKVTCKVSYCFWGQRCKKTTAINRMDMTIISKKRFIWFSFVYIGWYQLVSCIASIYHLGIGLIRNRFVLVFVFFRAFFQFSSCETNLQFILWTNTDLFSDTGFIANIKILPNYDWQ